MENKPYPAWITKIPSGRQPEITALEMAITELESTTQVLGLSRRALEMLGSSAPDVARRDVKRLAAVLLAIDSLKEIKVHLEQHGHYTLKPAEGGAADD